MEQFLIYVKWLDKLTSRQIKLLHYIKTNKNKNGHHLLDMEFLEEYLNISNSGVYKDLQKLIKEKMVKKTKYRNMYE